VRLEILAHRGILVDKVQLAKQVHKERLAVRVRKAILEHKA
jgi:hypothetical protein